MALKFGLPRLETMCDIGEDAFVKIGYINKYKFNYLSLTIGEKEKQVWSPKYWQLLF